MFMTETHRLHFRSSSRNSAALAAFSSSLSFSSSSAFWSFPRMKFQSKCQPRGHPYWSYGFVEMALRQAYNLTLSDILGNHNCVPTPAPCLRPHARLNHRRHRDGRSPFGSETERPHYVRWPNLARNDGCSPDRGGRTSQSFLVSCPCKAPNSEL